MEKKLTGESTLTTNNKTSILIFLILCLLNLISCNNLQGEYGIKTSVDSKLFLTPNVYNPTSDYKIIRVNFLNNVLRINNRNIILRADTIILYRGHFKENQNILIKFPSIYLGKNCNPNLLIYEKGSINGYYFENKEGLNIGADDNKLDIEFFKSKEYSKCINFSTSH